MTKLDPEEKELLESYDREEWQSVSNLESESERFQKYARATFRKDKRVNIRIYHSAASGQQPKNSSADYADETD